MQQHLQEHFLEMQQAQEPQLLQIPTQRQELGIILLGCQEQVEI